MDSVTKILVLKFQTGGSKTHTINVNSPKENLSFEAVEEQMNKIIDSDAVLTARGEHLTGVHDVFYKTTTIERLEPENGE